MVEISKWQDIVKELKGRSALVLMYLALGEDCSYNMAKNFSSGLSPKYGWGDDKLKGFKILKHSNEIGILLNDMKTRGLLIDRREKECRKQHFYQLDPIILYDFSSIGKLFLYPLTDIINIELFLDRLKGKVKKPNKIDFNASDLSYYFKLWSSYETYDYNTFVLFLEYEAEELGMANMKDSLRKIRYQYSNFDTILEETNYKTKRTKMLRDRN